MTVIFEASWSDYEEGESMTLFVEGRRYFARHVGHNVMSGSYDNVSAVSAEEALELMEEWADLED